MIKYTLILVNFIGLFLWNLFAGSELLVENNAPTQIAPGDKKEVTIHINKKEIEGFAKMELTLPPGFIVTPGETQGASFTFSQQKARFVWMTLPNMEDFSVTYFIECIDGMQGNYSISGTFSYIKENKRLDYVIPSKSVMVSKDVNAIAANTTASATSAEPTSSPSTPSEVNVPTTTSVGSSATSTTPAQNEGISYNNEAAFTQPKTTSRQDTSGVIASVSNEPSMGASSVGFVTPICERTITKLSDTDFEVTVTIRENNIVGFARIYEIVPSNCSTEIAQNAGSMTTREVNTVKFVWFEVPNSPVVVVSYKIHCTEALSGMPEIKGKLSYVLDQKPVDQPIINQASESGEVLAQTSTTTNNDTDSTKSDTPVNSNVTANIPPAKTTDVAENTAPKKSDEVTTPAPTKAQNNNSVEPKKGNKADNTMSADNKSEGRSKPVTTVASAEQGITYKVQILAAHRVVDKSYFRQKHKYDEGFNIENHEGWVKYTTGRFGEYKEARDERERLRSDYGSLPGPFVTAYNNGERITVQEALLISKQQWYK